MRKILSIFLSSSVMVLSGCSTIGIGTSHDSGQIDYRLAEPAPVTDATVKANSDAAETANDARAKNAARPTSDEPLAPAPLVRKYSAPRNAFDPLITDDAKKQVYSIILEQMVMGGYIAEPKFFQPAEIVVLANAFEFGSDAKTAKRFYQTDELLRTQDEKTQTGAVADLKVVYFSPDVFLNQPLNFSAQPIIPPVKYNGRPIGIQIIVLELDRMSGPVKSLLKAVADLGQATNVANPLPGVNDIALDLGKSILDGNTKSDDVLVDFQMTLYPKQFPTTNGNGSIENPTATFQPGRYVLRRKQSRKTSMVWSDLYLDHNSVRLMRKNGEKLEEFRDDTYMVLNIVKHAVGTPEATYAHQTFAEFNSVLAEAANTDGTQALSAITKNIQEKVSVARSKSWLTSVQSKWLALSAALSEYDNNRYPGVAGGIIPPPAACPLKSTTLLRPYYLTSQLKVKQAAAEFVSEYQKAMAAKGIAPAGGGITPSQFSEAERTSMYNEIALYAVPKNIPKDATVDGNFVDLKAFETAYIVGKPSKDLADMIIGIADKVPHEYDCDTVEQRGWKL